LACGCALQSAASAAPGHARRASAAVPKGKGNMHVHRNRAAGCLRAGLAALVFAGSGLLPTIAGATDFNASGSVSLNGHAANLADGLFIGSSYATATGAVGAGHFKFVGASVGDGTVALVFDLGQANTSSGLVTANGAA